MFMITHSSRRRHPALVSMILVATLGSALVLGGCGRVHANNTGNAAPSSQSTQQLNQSSDPIDNDINTLNNDLNAANTSMNSPIDTEDQP
jgi:outer membrane murein-binding lipoprotein Lpp